jgi:MSHA biogenesis protein MshK
MHALLSLFVVLSLPVAAEVLTDPTRPPTNWEPKPTAGASQPRAAPQLTSVLVSAARRVAVIDGVTLAEGETANGITVVRVARDWVDANVRGAPVRLTLTEANVVKEPR